jgi:hypothetical protein
MGFSGRIEAVLERLSGVSWKIFETRRSLAVKARARVGQRLCDLTRSETSEKEVLPRECGQEKTGRLH